jgi:hypothetical protein
VASFATPDDLADYLGRDRFAEPTEYRQAVMVLDLASGEIRAWTRQTIDFVTDDEVVLVGSWCAGLQLPERPVVSVSSVTFDGRSLVSGTDYDLAAGSLLFGTYRSGWFPQGAAGLYGASTWGGPETTVQVTYTHGFATVPTVVKSATLAIAGRLIGGGIGGTASGGQVRSETIAGYSVTYANAGATTALQDSEMSALRYLRRTW